MDCNARAKGAQSSRGFSIVEALTGMAVLLVAVLTLIGVVPAAYGFSAQDSVHVQAVAAGQNYLDVIRQYIKSYGVDTNLPPPPAVPIDPGYGFKTNQALPSSAQFAMVPNCSALSLFSFDCTVTVSWTENNVSQSVKVESYIASQAGF